MAWPAADAIAEMGPAADTGPRHPPSAADAADPPHAVPPWLRANHLLPLLAAEMMAALGVRLRLRVDRPRGDGLQAPADWVSLGGIGCLEGRLLMAMDGDAALELLAAAFGSDRTASPPETVMLSDLAPGNASWKAFGALMRRAAGRALSLAGAGHVTDVPPTLADADLPRLHAMPLLVSGPGLQLAMELLFVPAAPVVQAEPERQEPSSSAGDDARPDPWQGRLDALSQGLTVPVTLELCAEERPLADVMDLGVGDVIRLPAIDTVVMKVAGSPWRDLPLAALTGPAAGGEAGAGHAGEGQP